MTKGLPRSLRRGSQQQQIVTKLTIPLRGVLVNVSAVGANIGWGTAVIGDFPNSHIKMMAAAASLRFSGPGTPNLEDNWTGTFSIGTDPTADATLNGSEVNIIASTNISAATGEVSPVVTAVNGVDAVFNNANGALEVNLNMTIAAASISDDQTVPIRVDGVVEITYITML